MEEVQKLKKEISEIEALIDICKQRGYSKSIIFILTALHIKKKEKLGNR